MSPNSQNASTPQALHSAQADLQVMRDINNLFDGDSTFAKFRKRKFKYDENDLVRVNQQSPTLEPQAPDQIKFSYPGLRALPFNDTDEQIL